VNAIVEKHFKKRFGNVSFVAEQLSEQVFCRRFKCFRVSVIHICGREVKGERFAPVVANQMQFEAIEPSRCAFAKCYRITATLGIDKDRLSIKIIYLFISAYTLPTSPETGGLSFETFTVVSCICGNCI
jgi:hypothetical protein